MVIFLDVDGVLHPLNEKHLPKLAKLDDLVARADSDMERGEEPSYTSPPVEGEFLEENMHHLCHIVSTTSAKIVLSSTWRETRCGQAAVAFQLAKHGISTPIIGCTPILGMGTQNRVKEIEEFLNQNQNVKRYVCLDDADLTGWAQPGHFVRCNSGLGLTSADAKSAIDILC